MTRLPIKLRLTIVFALATMVVLAASAVFVYARLRQDLDEAVMTALRARLNAAEAVLRRGDMDVDVGAGEPALEDPEEAFAQALSVRGGVVASAGGIVGPALTQPEIRRAAAGQLTLDRELPGLEGTVRMLARPGPDAGGATVLAVGQSLGDRDETLDGLVASFAIGGPIAVLVASMLGYALATASLRPVEAMRRRAADISLSGGTAALPLPAAQDEIRRLAETLNDMLARLRRSYERERRFVADAGHELRTPIAVLKTELEGALRNGDFGPDVRDALSAAVEECDHIAQLAEDLLVLARSGEGRLEVRPESLDAAVALGNARERFVDRATRERRRILVDAPDALEVYADPLRLRQALGNLLDNALRHGAGDVVLAARRNDGGVAIDVSDGGDGVPAALGDRVFERFTRGDESRTRGGSGLGLAIVRAIAEAHDGRATIIRDGRATIRLWLPCVSSRASSREGG